ncbi:uncharacterized protein LOC122876738 isoform X2 [Lates japonicus]|uniref:Uncharacterized protein n=1 Tax=Lates japonicus TaxID=270547 RepID=A0AAD3NGK1_LATJO|nr:uncharacterized protein AKAME5_002336200 [Lates japonicus]GLD72040.1 uncharacterized protein AKAME5_002336400 [Lates japonicus]
MKKARTPAQRRVKTEAQDSAAKQVLDSQDKRTARQRPFSKLGLPPEKIIEQEKQRRHLLINEHNKLTLAVKEKEAKLKELQETLRVMNLQPTTYSSEDALKQRIRQLENDREKMKMKITQAKKIQMAYRHILENLQEEVRGIKQVLDQKEHAVAVGQVEVDKATKMFQSAAAATDSSLGMMVQMEYETMEKRREMDSELCELSAEEKELKKKMEIFGCLSPTAQSRLEEAEILEEEEERSAPVKDHQCHDICGASESDMKVVEDMEALREALACADIQELVSKVLSQRATKEQLLTEITQYEDLIEHETKILADLELQFAELKFSEKPAVARFDKLKEQAQAKLNPEVKRVGRLQAELKQSQDLLDAVEQGINNLYFRMSCVPVEGLPSTKCTDSIDKLKDISARLPTLLQRALTQKRRSAVSGLDQENVYSVLEKFNTVELRNNKRPTTPTETPQLSDDEEECSPSRDEIKRSGMRLIESQQNKKSSRGRRK